MFIFLKHTIILLMIMLYILSVDAKAEEAPTHLHVMNVTDQNITIAWDDVEGESGYNVYKIEFLEDGGSFTYVYAQDADTISYTATSSAFSRYRFSVEAVYDNGNSMSESIDVNTTHHWSGDLLKCANLTLGYGYVDTHVPTKTELESVNQFACTFKTIMKIEATRDLKNTTLLYLEHNNISVFPDWINELEDLQYLDLSANDIEGGIPEGLWELRNLESLNLAHNHLSGILSPNLNNLTHLRYLKLYSNNLSGEIPANLDGLKWSLEWMFLENNEFNGTIPDTIGNLSALSLLHLEDNNFSNGIPAALNNLQNIFVLCLENNELNGTIPQWVGNKTGLGALYLYGNHFSGKIPANITNLSNLDDANGLKIDKNDCLFSDNNSTLEAFIDKKSSEFGGYAEVVNSNSSCANKAIFNLIPVISFILE